MLKIKLYTNENNNLECTTASYAEDYRLCVEMAKLGAKFYVESQALIYYRISNRQKSKLSADEQQEAT
ncbi:MAG: hypothetical protein Q4F97_12510 [Bacteroidales bacterium]|nr:hypothetical protein [Bacteroidales bacterium]